MSSPEIIGGDSYDSHGKETGNKGFVYNSPAKKTLVPSMWYPGFFETQVPLDQLPLDLYRQLPWGDVWQDAEVVSAIRYARASKKLSMPSEWKDILLEGLM